MTNLVKALKNHFNDFDINIIESRGEVTLEINSENITSVCLSLRDEKSFKFNMLIDVCGVDYLHYGVSEWQTENTTLTGFSRAADRGHQEKEIKWDKPRYAVVYHLLSTIKNTRLRIRAFIESDSPLIDSVIFL